MKVGQREGVVVLWSADVGAATRELRITRGMAATCVVVLGALIGVCLWLGWELGHWSAKSSPLRATLAASGDVRAA